MDGFTLSHMIEAVQIPEQEEMDEFLPAYEPQQRLDPDNPVTMGAVGVPEIYMEAKKQCEQALLNSKKVVREVLDKWADLTGRRYELVEKNGSPEADIAFVSMGSLGETLMTAVDSLNQEGESVRQVRLRLWRPFPEEEFLQAIKGVKTLVVLDRALSPGSNSGPVAQEIKSLMYGKPGMPEVRNVIVGVGGRDVPVREFKEIFRKARSEELDKGYTIWGVRSNAG
jgi:pyruvate ferredoxin oxidoreductase alpha subunit